MSDCDICLADEVAELKEQLDEANAELARRSICRCGKGHTVEDATELAMENAKAHAFTDGTNYILGKLDVYEATLHEHGHFGGASVIRWLVKQLDSDEDRTEDILYSYRAEVKMRPDRRRGVTA